jgi:hypothetical protein
MRAIRVLRERGMSNSLMFNQHRIAAAKKLGNILRALQWSDGVDLSRGGRLKQNAGDQKATDRVSNDQGAVTQSPTLEDWQVFDGTNGPLGSRPPQYY